MDMTPQAIRAAAFRTVKRGYDPDEVESFRAQVAELVEYFQNQATAMEARARAAVAKLQELTQQASQPDTESVAAPGTTSSDELPDMISRTLLLAQRTADAALADAREQATSLVEEGREEAARMLESARVMASRTIDDARHEARRASEEERVRAENEVQALLARRDFLLADVDHLELFIHSERERLRDAANHLLDMVERAPGGLGEARRPLLSASDDSTSFWGDTAGDGTETAAAASVVGAASDAEHERVDEHDHVADPDEAVLADDESTDTAPDDHRVSRMPMGDITAGLDVTAAMPLDDEPPRRGAEVGVGRAAPKPFDDTEPIDSVEVDVEALGATLRASIDDVLHSGFVARDASVPVGADDWDDWDGDHGDAVEVPPTVDPTPAPVADDTWDPLTVPFRPAAADAGWDDDMPMSAAAAAAQAAAERRRVEAEADAAERAERADDAPSDELWRSSASPSVRQSFDDLSERLRRPLLDETPVPGGPYDADDDTGFIVGGDELQ